MPILHLHSVLASVNLTVALSTVSFLGAHATSRFATRNANSKLEGHPCGPLKYLHDIDGPGDFTLTQRNDSRNPNYKLPSQLEIDVAEKWQMLLV
jgi:hypothetical protein